ncbi:MAG: DUF58 domain-containing protein [Chloroflexi bacterium]|nr:DUF58 domain-containing protein [Chloroflexota bacterium]
MVVFLKVYVAIVLAIATLLSPLALSFVPILLLVGYLYLWRWPITVVVNLLSEYFIFFAITLLFTLPLGSFLAPLLALPVLLLINHSLVEAAESLAYRNTKYVRRLTDLCLAFLLIAVAVLGVALLFGSLPLLLAGAAIIIFFGALGILIHRGLPSKPVAEIQIQQRMVAGTEDHLSVKLTAITKIGGRLFVESPYEWLKVSPDILSLKRDKLEVRVSLAPRLAGPSIVKLQGYAIDRWGLIQVRFKLEPIRLFVIPRARYAAWLAKRYLAGTKAGALPLISNIAALKPIYGLRRGIEYYGSQLYQPGDSLKNIDWKHSLRHNELITKEFSEFQGRSAVILINLAVGNAEEADELASKIIVAAISLAQENIPAALAVYNQEDVKLTTGILTSQQLLLRSLRVAQEMVTVINPVKYLSPPDVARLRANINRLQFARSKASGILAQLLQIEYKNLGDKAKVNPATKALSEVLTKVDNQSNLVIISQCNYDAEAVAFNTFSFAQKGNAIITV